MSKTEHALVLATAGAIFTLAAGPADAQEREWLVVPYLWGADTSLDALVRDDEVYGGDLDFSDLVDKLDFALQLHVETRKDRFGLMFDLTYLETSDSFTSPANPPLPGGTVLATESDLTIFEAGGFYRPSAESFGWDLLFGVRAIDVNADLTLTPPGPFEPRVLDGSSSLTDGFAGVRYSAMAGNNWLLSLRGDVGAGDSDLAWNVVGLLGYVFGENDRYNLMFGYRHFALEYDDHSDGVPVEIDMTMSGPQGGFAFRF